MDKVEVHHRDKDHKEHSEAFENRRDFWLYGDPVDAQVDDPVEDQVDGLVGDLVADPVDALVGYLVGIEVPDLAVEDEIYRLHSHLLGSCT